MNYKEIPLFYNIPDEGCEKLVQEINVTERSYRPGQLICDYMDCDDSVGIVVDGEVFVERIDVNGYRTILERMQKSGIFGKSVAYASSNDCVSVICSKTCRIIFVSYERLMERCKKNYAYHSEISANILSMILSKTAYLADRVEVISHRNTREKLMCYFRMLAGGGDVAFLPINFSQLADYICADRSAMMRELKNMKEDGLIATEKRKIFITENR